MIYRCWLLSFFLVITFTSIAQVVKVQGVVRNAYSYANIEGAEVEFKRGSEPSYTVVTDSLGKFTIDQLVPGRYEVLVQATGFQTERLANHLVGRTNIPLTVELKPIHSDIPEVVISDRKSGSFVHPLSNALVVTREETEKLPAGFFDPARLFTNQAGVSSANDGANHLIIRGNNPLFVKWSLHGTEILNPNHLSNAGTFSDQSSPSGGGVNMISASILDNTNLFKGPYDATRGNALAGVLDLNLRKGNADKLTTEAQISLLGMELGLEGPLSKKGASFLARYRYSTVGLLSLLGAQFGDENINYQDVMVHASFPTSKRELSFFLFTGNNMNEYKGNRDSAARKIQKEQYDIFFKGNQTIAGMLYEYKTSSNSRWLTDFIYTRNHTSRNTQWIDRATLSDGNEINLQKINIHPRQIVTFNRSSIWTTGAQIQINQDRQILVENNNPVVGGTGKINYSTIQPYSNVSLEVNKWTFQGGLHSMITKGAHSIEPRAQFSYRASATGSFQLMLGKYSQAFSLPAIDEVFLMRSLQGQLGYLHRVNKTSWSIAGYYQYHYGIPGSGISSLVNESPTSGFFIPKDDTKGKVIGVESEASGVLGAWRWNGNLALFNSQFKDTDDDTYSSRFDQRYLFHGSIGREWEKSKSKSRKMIGWYTALQAGGALRDTPIDFNGTDVILRANALNTITRPGLYRLDMRVYRRKFYKHINTLLALDIQNLTSQKNFAFSYFDQVQKSTVINYQLGILPNLSFTIEY